MEFKARVNDIVNKYLRWEEYCEREGISEDNDMEYGKWLNKISASMSKAVYDDLTELCEDNEIMKNTIKKYFEIKVDNKEDFC